MGEEEQVSKIRTPAMLDAFIPIISLVNLLGTAVYLYGSGATGGPIQVALILCTMIAGLVGLKNGHSWEDMGHAAVEGSPRRWALSLYYCPLALWWEPSSEDSLP
jgi:hypothetical protein